jgi:hypothetical protein
MLAAMGLAYEVRPGFVWISTPDVLAEESSVPPEVMATLPVVGNKSQEQLIKEVKQKLESLLGVNLHYAGTDMRQALDYMSDFYDMKLVLDERVMISPSTETQAEAVAVIENLGGSVDYSLRDERFGQLRIVATVDLANTAVTDEDLECLRNLPHLWDLNLYNTPVTDEGLECLRNLSHLMSLYLSNTRITGSGLAHLQGLTDLEVLYLSNTSVDNAGLRYIKGLAKMYQLVLDGTDVSDAGLVHLEGMTNLERLGLANTGVTDAGLHHLHALPKLQRVNLTQTKVTDAGIWALPPNIGLYTTSP